MQQTLTEVFISSAFSDDGGVLNDFIAIKSNSIESFDSAYTTVGSKQFARFKKMRTIWINSLTVEIIIIESHDKNSTDITEILLASNWYYLTNSR